MAIDKNKIIEILKGLDKQTDEIYEICKNKESTNEETFENATKKLKKVEALIDITILQIQSRCKSTKFDDKKSQILNMVCACHVNLQLQLSNALNNTVNRFSVNGYSISKNNSEKQIKTAKKMFDEWRSLAAPLLVDEGFAFFAPKDVIKT